MDYPLSQATELDLYLGKFTNGEPGVRPASIIPAETTNAIIDEIKAVIIAAGITPDETEFTQLRDAIENLIAARSGNYALDTGNVDNAYVIALTPQVNTYTDGLTVRFRTSRTNAAGATLDAGDGPVPLKREDGAAVEEGDIKADAIIVATYVTSVGAFLVNEILLSQLGALAKLNIGAGLVDDGNGNLAITGSYAYINAATNVFPGKYLVDTSGGAVPLLLPPNPVLGQSITFADAEATWGTNNVTLLRNGNTIMERELDLIVDTSDFEFTLWFNGSDWRLV
jgi:hypothetical protein